MKKNSDPDSFWMEKALKEGEKSRALSPPNPWVGALLVFNGKIIGRGRTQKAGKAHAEVRAIEDCKKKGNDHLLKESTLYVTLEPCHHFGRTPPCSKAIIEAGIKKVVVGTLDPDEKVSGKGIAFLKEKGITIIESVLESEVLKSLAPYLHHRKTKKPWVLVKTALSLDGKLAASDNTSQWISSPECAEITHTLRSHSQAILVGVNTVLKDNPSLSVRLRFKSSPLLKIVLDPSLKTPPESKIFENGKVLIICCNASSEKKNSYKKNTDFFEFPEHAPFNLEKLLFFLGEKGILQLLVEGGGETLSHFFEKELVNEAVFYFSPLLLGKEGVSFTDTLKIETLSKAPLFHLESLDKKGNSAVLKISLRIPIKI